MRLFPIIIAILGIYCLPIFSQTKIDSFSLKDQKDIDQPITFPATQNRVIIVTDSGCRDQAKEWGERLRKKCGKDVRYTVVVAVGSVPEWQKGFVKDSIKSELPRLIDWGNITCKKWGYSPKQCLVLFVGKNGEVIHRSTGGYTDEKWATWFPK